VPEVVDELDLDFGRWVRPGDTVIWGQACAEPLTLTETLLAQRHAVGGFRAFLGLPAPGTAVRADHTDAVTFISYTGAGVNRELHRLGALEVLDADYSSFPELFHSRQVPIDVALVQVPPAFADETHSLGLAHEYLGAAVDAARVVVLEVNDQLPQVLGTRRLHPDEVTAVVHTSHPPLSLSPPESDEVTQRIAANAADRIEDGSTLQVGIGSLPDGVLAALHGHADLGIHSGMIGEGFADLIEAGVVTNTCKFWDVGISVGGVLMGGPRLFELASRDESLQLRPTSYTHDPDVIGALDRFVSVNSALEIDLTGAVNTERLGTTYVGARGGAVDFARGATRSSGGKSLTVLPSTGRGRSRIVPRLDVPASVPAELAGIVVTEHGAADLRGRSAAQRAEMLIAIAHPDHRWDLERSLSDAVQHQEVRT
jgi:acyl-CoA hydrolase